MASPQLSIESEKRVTLLFAPSEQEIVRLVLLEECGNNLSGLEKLDEIEIDRFRFAVLKLSEGNLLSFDKAIQLAKTDWRDLLMAAGFGESLTAHKSWLPTNGELTHRSSGTPNGAP